jgi:hypothetical protein
MYYFALIDGKPRFAIARTFVTEQITISKGVEEIQREVYIFSEDELSQYSDVELLEQPSAEILKKVKKLEGKTLSKTEFEKLLSEEEVDIEQRITDLEQAVAYWVGGGLNA